MRQEPADAPSSEPASGEPPARWTRRQLAWLAAITVLAAALRFSGLGTWSFWVDEAHTWRDATLPLEVFLASDRAWYPLTYLGLRGLLDAGVIDGSEWSLRLPFALCGILSVPVLAWCGRGLVGNRAALVAALFAALVPWQLYWSQNARGYAFVFLFAPLAAAAWHRGVEARRPWYCLLAVPLVLAGAAFHPSALLQFAVFAAHLLFRPSIGAGRATFSKLFAVAVLALAVAPFVLQWVPSVQGFLKSKRDVSLLHLAETTAYYFRVLLLLAAATGVLLLARGRSLGRALYLGLWIAAPLAVLMVVGGVLVKTTARYAYCALPAVLLAAGACCDRFAAVLEQGASGLAGARLKVASLVLPALLALDLAAYDYLYFRVQYGDRGRWREARDHVVAKAAEGPSDVTVLTVNAPTMLYYLRPRHYAALGASVDPHPRIRVLALTGWAAYGTDGQRSESKRRVDQWVHELVEGARAERRQLFVIVSRPELDEQDYDGWIWAALQRDFTLQKHLPCTVGPKDEGVWVFVPADAR